MPWGDLTVMGRLLATTFMAQSLAIAAGGVVEASSLADATGTIANNGTIETTGLTFSANSALTGSGTIDVNAYDTYVDTSHGFELENIGVKVVLAQAAANNVDFTSVAGQLTLESAATFIGSIIGFGAAEQDTELGYTDRAATAIVLADVSYASIEQVTYSGSTGSGVLTISTGTGLLQLQFTGNYTLADFDVLNAGGEAEITAAPCFAAGTLIATPEGEIAVEHLRPGDLVRTKDGEARTIAWVGRRTVDLAGHPDPALVRPVLIRAGAFAAGVPTRDLRVSPDHNIAFADVLIPAKCLVNGTSVVVDARAPAVTYHHIELPTHDLVLAEGLAAETYLDVGNRALLQPDAAGPADFSSAVDLHWAMWEALGCRRLVLVGPELDQARAVLGAREAARAWRSRSRGPAPSSVSPGCAQRRVAGQGSVRL